MVCGKKRSHKNLFGVCEECAGVRVDDSLKVNVEQETKGVCKSCGKYRKMYSGVNGGEKVCLDCLPHSGKCTDCSEQSHLLILTNIGEAYCPNCQVKKLKGHEQRWNYTPRKFLTHGKNDFMLGVENEVQIANNIGKHDYLDQITKSLPQSTAYTVYDGTIDYGTEIVFHPRTLESYRELDYSGMFQCIVPHRSTGMHVHIERKAFLNKMHLYKFIRFIVKNRDFIKVIAERDTTIRRSWKFTKEIDAISKVKGYDVDPDKYMDINMLHHKTIEVRIFKGATKTEQLLKNLEFCHSLVKFSQETRPKYMTVYRLKRWLKDNQSLYQNLTSFIEEKGL